MHACVAHCTRHMHLKAAHGRELASCRQPHWYIHVDVHMCTPVACSYMTGSEFHSLYQIHNGIHFKVADVHIHVYMYLHLHIVNAACAWAICEWTCIVLHVQLQELCSSLLLQLAHGFNKLHVYTSTQCLVDSHVFVTAQVQPASWLEILQHGQRPVHMYMKIYIQNTAIVYDQDMQGIHVHRLTFQVTKLLKPQSFSRAQKQW